MLAVSFVVHAYYYYVEIIMMITDEAERMSGLIYVRDERGEGYE